MNTENFNDFNLDLLKQHLDGVWKELFEKSSFLNAVKMGETTKALYALYLIETYHYTNHNPRNQALVGVRAETDDLQYQRFCFQHAAEETGHEQMALHDIKNLGLPQEAVILSSPLPETTVLTAYLYWVALNGNPIQRLGYSFWAESCYEYILPLMKQVTEALQLTNSQTTFFVAHAEIDEDHSQQVNSMITRMCSKPEDWQAVTEVMETSLRLTGNMMESVYQQYKLLINNESERYSFLRELASRQPYSRQSNVF